MKKLTIISLTLAALFSSNITLADVESPHTVGLEWGGGGIDYKGKDTDGEGIGLSYLYYNYQFSPNYYVELGLLGGHDVDDWECNKNDDDQWECLSDYDNDHELQADNVEFGGLVFALKTDMNLTERNKLYAKLGAVAYNYEMDLNRVEIADESGVGYLIEAGWEYRWDNGMGINAGWQYQDYEDLEVSTLNIGFGYSF